MIKSELVQKIAEKNPHLYHRDIERIVNTVLDEIINALKGVPPVRDDADSKRPTGPSVAVPISPRPEPA